MTREEIINEIKCLLSELDNGEDAVSYLTHNDVKWLNENIKALEQQPCEDCVSRKSMLEYQQYLHGKMSNEENHKLWEFIKALPSVTPKLKTGHWIPKTKNWLECSECGHMVYSQTESNLLKFHAFCGRCGVKMIKP